MEIGPPLKRRFYFVEQKGIRNTGRPVSYKKKGKEMEKTVKSGTGRFG